jgi:hypothetical protein
VFTACTLCKKKKKRTIFRTRTCFNLWGVTWNANGLTSSRGFLWCLWQDYPRLTKASFFVNKTNLVHKFILSICIILYMFRAIMCPLSGETTVFFATLGTILCALHTSHSHRMTSTKCRKNPVVSPDDGHIVAQNMWRLINILRINLCTKLALFTRLYRDVGKTNKIHLFLPWNIERNCLQMLSELVLNLVRKIWLLVSIPCRKVHFPCDQKLVPKVPVQGSEIQNQSKYYNQQMQVRCR